jgi:hypothetical protein
MSNQPAQRPALDSRTAGVIAISAARTQADAAVQLLPDKTPEEKTQLRITLAAIRAMRSREPSKSLRYKRQRKTSCCQLIVILCPGCSGR